jgi:hypothetical protein
MQFCKNFYFHDMILTSFTDFFKNSAYHSTVFFQYYSLIEAYKKSRIIFPRGFFRRGSFFRRGRKK